MLGDKGNGLDGECGTGQVCPVLFNNGGVARKG